MIYAIGDVHGQVTMLRMLLDYLQNLPLDKEDTLLFLGDYVDRGENSCAVLETLLELRQQRPNTIFLRGNHEQLMLEARDGRAPQPDSEEDLELHLEETLLWLQNGGRETLLSYEAEDFQRWREAIPDAHWEFVRSTELERLSGHYHFVHAGLLPPGKTWEGEEMGLDYRLWIRDPFLKSNADFGGRIVVFGHTPQLSGNPLVKRNKIGLDTGAVFGGPLTAVALDPDITKKRASDYQFYQAPYVHADTLDDLEA